MYLESLLFAEPPDRLYHYTSAAGVRGILKDQAFWFTDVFHQKKDPDEWKYGLSEAAKVARRWIDETSTFEDREVADVLTEALQNACQWFEGDRLQEVADKKKLYWYVGCFSDKGDLPAQWKDFGHGGQGYCLHIDGHRLNSDFNVVPQKVVYHDCQWDSLKKIWEEISCKAHQHPSAQDRRDAAEIGQSVPEPDYTAGQLADELLVYLGGEAVRRKKACHETEQEWRWVVRSSQNRLCERFCPDSGKPCTVVPICRKSIVGVTCGKHSDEDERSALERQILDWGYTFPIVRSEVSPA